MGKHFESAIGQTEDILLAPQHLHYPVEKKLFSMTTIVQKLKMYIDVLCIQTFTWKIKILITK
jgi:hypothetical protein